VNVAQLKTFCARLPGAEVHEHGAPANILVYTVGGKRFAHFKTSTPQCWRFSIKVANDRFLALTDIPGIQPARWLARYHWITVVDVSSLPTAELTEMVMWSYHKALSTLSRARRAQLTATP
jgi:predicted DNA-binding protein (MmcQ/YjbR family)